MKSFFRGYIKSAKPIPNDGYPVKISLDIFMPVDRGMDFDLDNLSWVYVKAISDVLVDCGIIINDTVEFITNTGECQFHIVDDATQRKMIINVFKNWTNES